MNWLLLKIYGLLMRCIQPLLRFKLARRAQQEPGYGILIPERFGQYSSLPTRDLVWVHAVSLGETRAAAILIAALREQWPHMRLLLTHGTATGREAGKALLRHGDIQVWQPWDSPLPVNRFLWHFQPKIGILMETEVWPLLVNGCAKRQIPLALVNARLNEHSLRKARKLAWLARPAYRRLALVLAQTEDDAQRLRQLGATVSASLGNLKFDHEPQAAALEAAALWRVGRDPFETRPVVMLASSREGEEVLWLQALDELGEQAAHVQWLIVPRHPQRFDEVARLIEARSWPLQRRSLCPQGFVDTPSQPQCVWLGDSLGEMDWYYGMADLALMGGSYLPLGGQNLIEACACGCPVILGPHTFNFEAPSRMAIEAGAAQRVQTLTQAIQTAREICADPLRHDAMRHSARAFAQSQRGTARKTAEHLRSLLPDF